MPLTQTILDYHGVSRWQYAQLIPTCCSKPFDEHEFPMLWCGRIFQAHQEHHAVDCQDCFLKTDEKDHDPALRQRSV